MKKTIVMSTILTIGAVGLLTGCSSPDEEPEQGTTVIESARSFEDNGDTNEQSDEETIVGLTSSTKEGNKASHADMKSLLEASAFSMEENKDKNGYMNELYYQANPLNPADLNFMESLSSKDSFCLRSTSREYPDLVMYYDSQTKSVVPNGKSCKPPIGKPWTSLETNNNQ